jgi:hypothetical protein
MVNATGIASTLNDLDILYNNNSSQGSYFSKLALLELCGWIEQTMDSIIKDCSNSHLSDQTNINFVEKQIVDRTNGFHYDSHFRPMLMKLIGLISLEKIEISLKASGDYSLLTSQLGTLKAKRDQAAHTTLSGVTPNYDAPSLIKSYLSRIHPILVTIDQELQTLNASTTTQGQPATSKSGCFLLVSLIFLGTFVYLLFQF